MVPIQLPPDIEGPLVEEARRLGVTPEQLVVDSLRKRYAAEPQPGGQAGETLYDFLAGYAGTISGTSEALSEDTGRRFADGMLEKQQRGRL